MVEVIVPYRASCPYRQRALDWVLDRYATKHPGWRVTVAEAPGGPWVKALAVMPAVNASTADVVVVADADCWTDGLAEAVAAVENGAAWAIPHMLVHRLSESGTVAVLADKPWQQQALAQRFYRGVPGGGFVVARRETLMAVPFDPRFEGWGQEDECLAVALKTLVGRACRGTGPLIHLWHPSPPRLDRKRGSVAGWELRRRYMQAHNDPIAMASLIQEAHVALNAHLEALHDPSTVAAGI